VVEKHWPRESLLLLTTLAFTYCVMQSFGGPPHAVIQLVKCLWTHRSVTILSTVTKLWCQEW